MRVSLRVMQRASYLRSKMRRKVGTVPGNKILKFEKITLGTTTKDT